VPSSLDACTHVVMLGVRGTFEPFDRAQRGLGPTLDRLAARIATAIGELGACVDFEAAGVDYPARAWAYWRSRTSGAQALAAAALDHIDRAPHCTLVLAGLSQGADAVRRALVTEALKPALSHIGAVVLLGDPTRRPDEGGWHHGTSDRSAGLLARWSTPIPEPLCDRTWSYCLDDDRIAANPDGVRAVWHSGAHTEYESNAFGVLDLATAFVVEQLDLLPRA
jgi:hypothetical protein